MKTTKNNKQVSKIEFTANAYAAVGKKVVAEGKTFGSVVRSFVEVASKDAVAGQMLRDIRKAAKIGTTTNANVLKKAIFGLQPYIHREGEEVTIAKKGENGAFHINTAKNFSLIKNAHKVAIGKVKQVEVAITEEPKKEKPNKPNATVWKAMLEDIVFAKGLEAREEMIKKALEVLEANKKK